MTTRPLSEILKNALTNPESPVQLYCVPHDSEKYEVVGDVPLPVRHLHNACCELVDQCAVLGEEAQLAREVGNEEAFRAIEKKMHTLYQRHTVISHLCSTLIEEVFPADPSDFAGIVILEDWKLAGEIKIMSPTDEMFDALRKVLEECDANDADQTMQLFLITGGRPH